MRFVENIRLKAALHLAQIQDRMRYRPEILEIHVKEENLNNPEEIIRTIQDLKSQGVRVYLHHPAKYRGEYLDIISSSQRMRDFYDWSCKELAMICRQVDVKCVIHCHYAESESSSFLDKASRVAVRKRLESILCISDQAFLWEDTIRGIFSADNPFLFSEIVEPLNLSLNIDVSHSFIALKGDNEKLERHLERFHAYAQYYHLVDSKGVYHDALPLGKGKINWGMVKSYVKDTDFIFEVDLRSSNHLDCWPMIESARYYNDL